MSQLTYNELADPPAGRVGWPWTEHAQAPAKPIPNGTHWPKISIVTPSYNQGQFIERTIRSVLQQGYPNLEYVIIDGASTDNTIDVIKKYQTDLTFWVSEPDRGQSHAINKGLAYCTGEIFNWLNADDFLCPGALHTVADTWTQHPGTLIAGKLIMLYENGTEKVIASNALTVENFVHWRRGHQNGCSFLQPATFMPRRAINAAGGVREDLQLVMDHFLMIDLLKRCRVTYIPDILAQFTLHKASKMRTKGHHEFMLEITRTLRAMPSLPGDLSRDQLRREHARLLVALAEQKGIAGKLVSPLGCLTKALALAPRTAAAELRGKRPVRRYLKTLLDTVHQWC